MLIQYCDAQKDVKFQFGDAHSLWIYFPFAGNLADVVLVFDTIDMYKVRADFSSSARISKFLHLHAL